MKSNNAVHIIIFLAKLLQTNENFHHAYCRSMYIVFNNIIIYSKFYFSISKLYIDENRQTDRSKAS